MIECIPDSSLFNTTGLPLTNLSSPPSTSPAGVVKLVCLDFDLTLAATHLYFELASKYQPKTTTEWLTAYTSSYSHRPQDVFGGPHRTSLLHSFLSSLNDNGADVYVVTKGVPEVVRMALSEAGLGEFFKGVTDYNPKQLAVLALMNSRYPSRLRYDQSILIDDDERNFCGTYSKPQELKNLGWTEGMIEVLGNCEVKAKKEDRGWGTEGIGEAGVCRVY
eukprot:CAMPEP_0118650022 /NCGR_PEP_ID=MMETSP0785-20121206/10023_1 /TAXON_ID=91992 /ORGANISM="Bolidomonas pacifica, Strain CCMP 1866" /LENGTH=219 /DNA_ID=CAMNT_0006542365 /DNA_START=206 /DNA_END=862 /DNA_ORIENTATION=-